MLEAPSRISMDVESIGAGAGRARIAGSTVRAEKTYSIVRRSRDQEPG